MLSIQTPLNFSEESRFRAEGGAQKSFVRARFLCYTLKTLGDCNRLDPSVAGAEQAACLHHVPKKLLLAQLLPKGTCSGNHHGILE